MFLNIRLLFWTICVFSFDIFDGLAISQPPPITTKSTESQQLVTASSGDTESKQVTNVEFVEINNLKTGVYDQHTIIRDKSANLSLKVNGNRIENSTTAPRKLKPNFNLAFILLVLGFVFLTALCLKCCQWFRQYTQGGSKDTYYMHYAEIVENGDDSHLDFVSDTTSMAPYDTVSSFASFLRRTNNNQGTVTSVKSFKSLHGITDSPRKWLVSKFGQQQWRNQSSEFVSSDIVTDAQLAKFKDQRTSGTTSSSSEETEATETDPLKSSDASILKKQNRFRVTFITGNNVDGITPGPLDCVLTSKVAICSNKSRIVCESAKPMVKTVGTQTIRTYRRSLRNAQIRFLRNKLVAVNQPQYTSKLLVSADVIRTTSLGDNAELDSSSSSITRNTQIESSNTQQISESCNALKLSDVTNYSNMSGSENNILCSSMDGVCYKCGFTDSEADIKDDRKMTSGVLDDESPVNYAELCSCSTQRPVSFDSDDSFDMTSQKKSTSRCITNDISDMCDLASNCTHCGGSLDNRAGDHSLQRHSSIGSDQRSVSLPSLESSGYVEQLSFDASD